MRKRKIGADIVKDNQMKMVLDNDLVKLLQSLKVLDGVNGGKYKCLFCGNKITIDNIDSIVPHEGMVQFTCDNPDCHAKLVGWA